MKRIMVSLGIVLVGIVFCAAPSYAECTYTNRGPYVTVIKYWSAKAKVQEMWECISTGNLEYYQDNNGVCFFNQVGASSLQYICITGDFKILHPVRDIN